jgi:prevent-host-death family protein
MAWPLQDAKQGFSRVVDLAIQEGPQVITRHGREVAVVMSVAEYRQLASGDLKSALRGLGDEGEGLFNAALEEVVADRARSRPRGDELFS